MDEQNKNVRKIVGISGLKMNNSSITETNISSSNPEGGNVGIFNTEMTDSTISKLNISDKQLSQENKEELQSYGLEDAEINDLNEIIQQNSDDKSSLKSKVLKWVGSVTSSLASKGLYDNFPKIMEFIDKVIQ